MKIRWNRTLISVVLQSLCLFTFIPAIVDLIRYHRHNAWIDCGSFREQNPAPIIGWCAVAFVVVGLITLWTGYRRQERSAWFVMFAIFICGFIGTNLIPTFQMIYPPYFQWSFWMSALLRGELRSLFVPEAVLTALVMLVALLLPVRAFFGKTNLEGSRLTAQVE